MRKITSNLSPPKFDVQLFADFSYKINPEKNGVKEKKNFEEDSHWLNFAVKRVWKN